MTRPRRGREICACMFFALLSAAYAPAQQSIISVSPDWSHAVAQSRTTITLQVVANPLLRRTSPIHDNAWNSLRQLEARDARLALWYPYPRLAVAELSPPTATQTFWDFSAMDPIVEDFFAATSGQPTVLSIATAPQWMFAAPGAPNVPTDPDTPVWNYEQGNHLRDPTMREIADYYGRVAGWYLRGGFRDELGAWHNSGHHLTPAYWEVFNEPEYEHNLSPAEYTRAYDAITARLHAVDPALKFTGMSLAVPDHGEKFFRYFLNLRHHAPGAQLDAISYHFYALGKDGETAPQQAASFFAQSDRFLATVGRIEKVRKRLSPATATQINETGCIAAGDQGQGADKMSGRDIPPSYWNLCGATFAYLSARLSALGIQVVGASQLLGYPTQYPSVSLLDWTTGEPNPRYLVLQLLIKNLAPGDTLMPVAINSPALFAQPILKPDGRRVVLLVNKTSSDIAVSLPGISAEHFAHEVHADIVTGSAEPASSTLNAGKITLRGFAVMFVSYGTP